MCAGCGVTTAMAPGVAAQIAQCRDGDDEPFRVNLRENGLGDEGAAKIITSVLANPRVTSLDLASNRITSEPCLLYTSPSPRDKRQSRMPSSA